MKFIRIPLVLFAVSAFGQTTIVYYNNQPLIDYFTRNIHLVKSVDGETYVVIPTEQKLKKDKKLIFMEGYPIQYTETGGDIVIEPIETKGVEFNFKTGKITKVNLKNDDKVFKRPKNRKSKIKKGK